MIKQYSNNAYNICLECKEEIFNPICHFCLAREIKQWLDEQKNKKVNKNLKMNLNIEIGRFVQLNKNFKNLNFNSEKCAVCHKGIVILCPYCFTEMVYKKLLLLTKSKKIHADFLSMFNFDFEHTGYSKDAEKLGLL